jgi:hypothetical protein
MFPKLPRYSYLFFLTSLLFVLFGGTKIFAQTLKTSGSNGDWMSLTWSPAGNPTPDNNVDLRHTVTIQEGSVVHINDLVITNNGKITVNGTLILNGSLSMENNGSEFSMGPNAVVIIYGDFIAANKVDVDLSSYLIIHGDFIKTGADKQGNFNVNDGNIFIFGEVSGWENFGNCNDGETYDGTTPEETGTCDYGDETDYEDNYENFPEEIKELENCLATDVVENQTVCEGESATFSITEMDNVTYQWQIKDDNGSWQNAESTTSFFTINNTNFAISGTQVRVVLRPTDLNCRIAISNTATLTVNQNLGAIGSISGPSEICADTNELSYSLPEADGALNYSWTLPPGWTILSGGNTNIINVQVGNAASSGTIKAEVRGSCDVQVSLLEVQVQSIGTWTGTEDSNWNNPANWSCNTLPTLETNVVIQENIGSGNYPRVSGGSNALTKDLLIETGATFTITGNWLRISGNVQNNGVLEVISGNVSFEGTAAQTIPSGTFADNRIENLQIDNASGVTSEGSLEITGILKIAAGNFQTGDSLTLISSAEKTALIDGSGLGEVIGTVNMQRYLDVAFGYKYFSTPFQNSVVGDFEPFLELSDATSGFPHVYRYEENRTLNDTAFATGWQAYDDPENILEVGEGYAFNFGANTDEKLVEISGEVNNGNFSRNLENNKGEYTKGFHLIGNPYPSPIDWDAIDGWQKTNIEDGIYFFTAGETQYTGTYTSYVNGVSSTNGNSSNIIPSMQGFFVKVTDPAEGASKVTGSLSISNKARVTDFDQQFLKTREREEKPLLRLTAAYETAAKKDAMVLYFSANAGKDFNKEMDAHKIMNTDASVPNFYILSKDKINLSIKALAFPESGSQEKIPLGIKAGKAGKMQISLADLQKFRRTGIFI